MLWRKRWRYSWCSVGIGRHLHHLGWNIKTGVCESVHFSSRLFALLEAELCRKHLQALSKQCNKSTVSHLLCTFSRSRICSPPREWSFCSPPAALPTTCVSDGIQWLVAIYSHTLDEVWPLNEVCVAASCVNVDVTRHVAPTEAAATGPASVSCQPSHQIIYNVLVDKSSQRMSLKMDVQFYRHKGEPTPPIPTPMLLCQEQWFLTWLLVVAPFVSCFVTSVLF